MLLVTLQIIMSLWMTMTTRLNDAGLNQSAAHHLSMSMKLKHGDLIRAIRRIVYKLYNDHSILVQFHKVKGHKVDFIQFDQLSHPEQLNELMDTCTSKSESQTNLQ
jgi:hypothetical protein